MTKAKTKNPTKAKTSTAPARAKASSSKANGGKSGQSAPVAAGNEITAGSVAKNGKRASTGSAGASPSKATRRATKSTKAKRSTSRRSRPKVLPAGAIVTVDGEEFFNPAFTGSLPKGGFLPVMPGRPTLFRDEYCSLVIELGRKGFGVNAIAARLGVDKSTLWHWVRRSEAFADAMKRARTAQVGYFEERLAGISAHGGRSGASVSTMFALRSLAHDDWAPPRAPTVEELDAMRLAALPPPEARPVEMTEADIAEIRNRLAKGLVTDLPPRLRIVSDTAGDVERSAFEEIGRRVMMRRMLEDDEGADSNRDVSPDELRAIEDGIAREEAEKAALAAMPPATNSIMRAMQLLAAKRGKPFDPEAFSPTTAAQEPEPAPVAPTEETKPLNGQILPPSPAPGRRVIDL